MPALPHPLPKRVGATSAIVAAIIVLASPDVQAMLNALVGVLGVSPHLARYVPWATKLIGLGATVGVWLSHSATGTGGKSLVAAPDAVQEAAT